MPNITAIWRELGLTSLQEFIRREGPASVHPATQGSKIDGYKCAHELLILVTAEPRGSRGRPYKGKRERKVGKRREQPWPQICLQAGRWMTL